MLSMSLEKITINVGFVDLGHIDLLVHEGFYSNRTDFIRTAIRNQLAAHADAVKQSIARHTLELGLRRYSREELEAVKLLAASCTSRSSGLRQSPKTSRRNSRLQQSNQSPSLALFTPAKQSRQRSLIASGDQPIPGTVRNGRVTGLKERRFLKRRSRGISVIWNYGKSSSLASDA
jgi:Arc/MetJ-type ribon-helix-helix transcriptional regulator